MVIPPTIGGSPESAERRAHRHVPPHHRMDVDRGVRDPHPHPDEGEGNMVKPIAVSLALLCATLVLASCNENPVQAQATDFADKGPMILNLRGSAVAESRTFNINGTPTSAMCFTVDLLDVRTQQVVGKGTDCIVAKPDERHASGLEVIGTTIFDLGNGNTITSRGLTTVQATTHGSPGITHVTGAIPPQGENSVIDGTGRFQGLRARVRLSGAVDMSRMEAEKRVYFDCIFIVHRL